MFVTGVLEGMKVLGFDLETTGFDPRSERIVEFAPVSYTHLTLPTSDLV